ncbi:MAG: ABC transporter substrate-binding protein [Acidimicrobiia bacterium]
MSPKSPLLVLLMALTVACATGSSIPSTVPPTTGTALFPITIESEAGRATIERRPERIASLSATATEILFAIGAGGQVAATDDFSNYPAAAEETEKVDAFQLNVEAVADLEPDLVVLAFDPGEAVESLQALEIPVILHSAPPGLEESFAQIEQLGAATGHVEEAAELVAGMEREIEEIASAAPPPDERLTYYHELDPSFFSVTSETFVGQVYGLLGLESIADQAAEAGSYPQLSAEFIIDADPDFIFLADTKCCGETAASLAERPGWNTLTAVQEDRVVELDDDVASRWGPRVVDLLRTVAKEVGSG